MAKFTVNAKKMKQHSHDLYLFSMSSELLNELCYVTPRSKNDPKEIQRLLDKKRAKDIGEYIKTETALLPNAIVISLSSQVSISPSGHPDEVSIQFPDTEGKYAYVLDGQHRLAGFAHSDGIQFDLPVVALYNANEHLRGRIFADINSKQVKVSDTHLLEIYYQIRELPAEESATMDIVHRLAQDDDSPLKGKIKVMDDERGSWVTNSNMKKLLAPHTESGGVLHGKPPAVQTQIIKEYLKGVKAVWPEAWGNNKDYTLTKSIGMSIILGIFGLVKHRVDLNAGKQYIAQNFKEQLEVLNGAEIEIPGGSIPLTWESGPFGTLSNAAGRAYLTKQLKNLLTIADEE